jgi:hypothetical protein
MGDGVWLGLLSLIAFLVWFANQSPLQFENPAVKLLSGLTRALVLTLVLGAVVLLGRAQQVKHQRLIGVGLLLLLWADVMTYSPRLNPTVDSSVYAPGLPDLQQLNLKPTSGQSRALLSREHYRSFMRPVFPTQSPPTTDSVWACSPTATCSMVFPKWTDSSHCTCVNNGRCTFRFTMRTSNSARVWLIF